MDIMGNTSNEKRLIDADKLLEIYKKWIPQLSSKEDEGDRRGVETCIAVLEDMQTIDAVEVVRCEKCNHAVWDEEYEMWKCVKSAEYDEESGVCGLDSANTTTEISSAQTENERTVLSNVRKHRC